jgi:hypothetical protein
MYFDDSHHAQFFGRKNNVGISDEAVLTVGKELKLCF